MLNQDRKTFLRTLGLAGAGALLLKGSSAQAGPVNGNPLRTEPGDRGLAKRVLRVAHLTDIHVKPEKIAEYGMAAALRAVNDMADRPDFVLNGGDAIMNAVAMTKPDVRNQWQRFYVIMKSENGLPLYNCIGNHDLGGWMP